MAKKTSKILTYGEMAARLEEVEKLVAPPKAKHEEEVGKLNEQIAGLQAACDDLTTQKAEVEQNLEAHKKALDVMVIAKNKAEKNLEAVRSDWKYEVGRRTLAENKLHQIESKLIEVGVNNFPLEEARSLVPHVRLDRAGDVP